MNEFYNAYWHELSVNVVIFKNIEQEIFDYFSKTTEYLTSTLEHLILFCILYIVTCIFLYILIAVWKVLPFTNSIKNSKRVLFITSHPDDEVMFFGPTILHFIQKTNAQVYLMCLSTGKNYGMGTVRKKELYNSCKVLGIKEENITVISHTNLPDKIDVSWPSDVVGKIVLQYIEEFDIDVLITFDRYGVSRHPNHCSVYFSVANLVVDRQLPKDCCVYVLETVDLLRKYWLVFDLPLTYLMSRIRYIANCNERKLIHNAMRQHKSQLLWYRWVYMYFSRYMMMNSLQKMTLADVELDLEIDD